MTVRRLGGLVLGLALLAASPAMAVRPDEILQDRALESRARALSQELRCMVCQNESIDDSNADLAHDLRVLVRERLAAGDSDAQVIAYLRARYGDFVLLRPPVERATWLLWFGPPAVLAAVLAAALLAAARRAPPPVAPLDAEERASVERLLDDRPAPAASGGYQTH